MGKFGLENPYNMLYDLHGIDERLRINRFNQPKSEFTVFYHLFSTKINKDIIIKVFLFEKDLNLPSITKIFLNSNWYEREVWEMFGIIFYGHPNLKRIIT